MMSTARGPVRNGYARGAHRTSGLVALCGVVFEAAKKWGAFETAVARQEAWGPENCAFPL